MPRKKKVEEVATPVKDETPMEEAMNPPVENQCKRISKAHSRVNIRDGAEGNVMFALSSGVKVLVEEEKDGWSKIVGYVRSDLLE